MDWDQDTSHDDVTITGALELAPGGFQLIHYNVRWLISKLLIGFIPQTMPALRCCSETLLKNDLFMLLVAGFEQFYSHLLYWSDNSNSVLLGSCMFVPSSLNPERTNICGRVAGDCSVFVVLYHVSFRGLLHCCFCLSITICLCSPSFNWFMLCVIRVIISCEVFYYSWWS